jgi:hypothetical protein
MPRAWRRGLALLAAAAAVTLSVAAAADRQTRHDARSSYDSGIPVSLEASLDSVVTGRSCLKATEAEPLIRQSIDRAGYRGWSIVRGGGVQPTNCVSWGVSTADQRVVLIPVTRAEITEALQRVRHELFRTCLRKDDAVALVASALAGFGETDPHIRADGPIVLPDALGEAAQRHVDAGCFVYSFTTWTPSGTPVYVLGGESPGVPSSTRPVDRSERGQTRRR